MRVVKWEALNKGKIRVIFEDGIRCRLYRKEAMAFSLREGEQISDADYQKLIGDVLSKRAIKRAMHLLEQMDRTEMKLRQKLKEGEYPQSCIEDAIAYVKKYHYLDDKRYAANYVRCAQEKKSRLQMRQKLAERGISRGLIDQTLDEEYTMDESEQIRELLQKRSYSFGKSDEKDFRRTYQFLMRRGFPGNLILKEMKADIVLDI